MEKAVKIFYILILCGVFLYFLPTILSSVGYDANASEKSGLISVSLDGGQNFKAASVHSGSNIDVYDIERSATNHLMVYAATNKGLFLSRDEGQNWYPFSDLEEKIDRNTVVYDILQNPERPGEIFAATSRGGKSVVYSTRDNFFTLTPVYDDSQNTIRELAASGGAIYFNSSDGGVIKYSPIEKTFAFESSEQSRLFANTYDTYGFSSQAGLALAASQPPRTRFTATAEQGSLVFAASYAKLYRSVDYGTHWTISEPIASNRVISVIRIANGDNIVMIGSKAGSYLGSPF